MSDTNTVSPLRQRMIEDMAARKPVLIPSRRTHRVRCSGGVYLLTHPK
jgi:hypothetical protein